jgi:Spy/CpxP family protein refolding chaperone
MSKMSVAVFVTVFAAFAAVRAEDKPQAAGQEGAGKRPAGAHGPNAEERMKVMSEKLGLDEKQKEQLKPVMQAQQDKMREIFSDANLAREQKAEKFKAVRDEFDAKIKTILTPEQVEKWQKMREEMRAKAGERMNKHGGGEKPAGK